MAVLKIEQVQGKVNTGNVPRTSALALPLSIANQEAAGFKAFSDGLVNIYAAHRKEEDLNEAQEITNNLSIDLIKSYNKHNQGTDLEVALENFNEDVNYENFKDLGSNKRVKKEVKDYVNKFQRKYSLDLLGKVTERHLEANKLRKENKLNDIIKARVAGGKDGAFAERDYQAYWTNPENITYFGVEGLAKKKEEADLQTIELAYIQGGKTGDLNLFNNEQRQAVLESLPPESQVAVIEKVRSNWLSNTLALQEEKIFAEKKDKQFKIETFTTALMAINDHKLMPTDENKSRVPSLDNLYDLKESGAINSSQYDQLLRFKANDKKLDDISTLQIIDAQFALADSVEKIDSLQEDVNLNANITGNLTPESIIKYNKLADKYKSETRFGIEDKKFRKLLAIGSKKISESSGMIDLSNLMGGSSTDYDFLVRAEARKNEYDDLTLNKNYTPEQAYAEVIEKLDSTELPELHDLEQPRSVNVKDFKKQLNDNPENTFTSLRQKVAEAFKKKKIDMQQYKDDLSKIDIIEDTFDTRLTIFGNVRGKALGKEFEIKVEN